MRQRITHGAVIDTATPQEIAEIVAASTPDRQVDESYRREKGVVQLDGAGAGQGIVTAPRMYDYICERVTCTAAAGAIIQFFENTTQLSDLLETTPALPASGAYSDAFSNKLFVPAGSQLFIVCTGGTANGQMTFNLQIKMVRTR